MPDGIDLDLTDVLKLAADLGEIPDDAQKFIRKAVEVTARHVRDDWRDPLKGSEYLPGGAYTVSYDFKPDPTGIAAEVGPELRGQGPLVGMLEYGTPTVGARGYGAAALERNQGDFEKGLSLAVEDAQKKAGL